MASAKFKEIRKGGWHPEVPGQNLRQQVVSSMGIPPPVIVTESC